MRSSQTISEFKRKLLKLIRPPERSIFNIHHLEGIKLLTQLRVSRVEFSDLCYHRYRLMQLSSTAQVPLVCARTGIEDNEHYSRYLQFQVCLSFNWSPIRLMLI